MQLGMDSDPLALLPISQIYAEGSRQPCISSFFVQKYQVILVFAVCFFFSIKKKKKKKKKAILPSSF